MREVGKRSKTNKMVTHKTQFPLLDYSGVADGFSGTHPPHFQLISSGPWGREEKPPSFVPFNFHMTEPSRSVNAMRIERIPNLFIDMHA